jgi:hypothetical protein
MAAGMPDRGNAPFLWGRGGKRMTPEDIALERRLATQQLATGADFSPVQHWTQGLARVANGLAGGLQMKRADAASEQNATDSGAQIAAILAGDSQGASDPIAAVLADPYASEQARNVATIMLRERNQAPPTPYRFEDNAGNQWELGPDGQPKRIFTDLAERRFVQDGQMISVPNPYASGAAPQVGGPPPEAVAELRANPSMIAEFDEVFGPGAAARVLSPVMASTPSPVPGENGLPTALTREQYQAIVAAKGQAATDEWARRNNITVGN